MNEIIIMTFDDWANMQGFSEEDINGPLHELRGCWDAAQAATREQCARICEVAADLVCDGSATARQCASDIRKGGGQRRPITNDDGAQG